VDAIAWLIIIGAGLWFFSHIRRGYQEEGRSSARRNAAPGHYGVEVVGESNYQGALEAICGGRSPDGVEKYVKANLVLEDSNPYDENAVRVDIDGSTVGYLSRHAARTYRERLKANDVTSKSAQCSAVIRGGWDRGRNDKGHFGVRLDL
jgi:hypothetical protein